MNTLRHLAVILDGNGRWAKSKGLPRNAGNIQGAKVVKEMCELVWKHNIEYFTVYAFSTENWSRPEEEVSVQIHVEADCDVHRELRRIREMGLRNALVFNPETPFERMVPYLGEVDEVLAMTVHPGYGGQSFIADCLPKITAIRRRAPDRDIMVDGGINAETAILAAQAGANQLVAGSYLFKQSDMAAAVAALRRDCAAAFLRP